MIAIEKPDAAPQTYSRVVPFERYAQELQNLYARRAAIDAVIQSLERYERFRARKIEFGNQKTA